MDEFLTALLVGLRSALVAGLILTGPEWNKPSRINICVDVFRQWKGSKGRFHGFGACL